MNMTAKEEWQCRSIGLCLKKLMAYRSCTLAEAYDFLGDYLLSRARTPTQRAQCTRTARRTPDINNNINILTKSAYVKGESMRGGEEKVADATARAPGFSLGFVLRNKPSSIPEYFAIWWYKSMKDRDWALAKGGSVTAANFRVHLCTWYKHVDVNETQEAHELYDKWKAIFCAQERFAAEEWAPCCGCDHFANGHCLACALKPLGAGACKKFAPLIE